MLHHWVELNLLWFVLWISSKGSVRGEVGQNGGGFCLGVQLAWFWIACWWGYLRAFWCFVNALSSIDDHLQLHSCPCSDAVIWNSSSSWNVSSSLFEACLPTIQKLSHTSNQNDFLKWSAYFLHLLRNFWAADFAILFSPGSICESGSSKSLPFQPVHVWASPTSPASAGSVRIELSNLDTFGCRNQPFQTFAQAFESHFWAQYSSLNSSGAFNWAFLIFSRIRVINGICLTLQISQTAGVISWILTTCGTLV